MAAARVFGGCRALMAAAKSATVGGGGGGAPATSAPAATSSRRKAKPRSNLGGLMRVVPVSPAMKRFLGVPEISRPDAVKKIWDYIKLHQLQNPANKKEINCDDRLKAIFDGKDKVGMLEIAKLIGPHFGKAS